MMHWLHVIVAWFRFRRKTNTKVLTEKPAPLPPEVPTPNPGEETVKLNRKTRRAKAKYERARRKYDKFVEPKGEPPVQLPPVPKVAKPRKSEKEEEIEDDSIPMMVDSHHEGKDDKVLYEETELWGEFNFRDTILTQLDRYFHYIKRMRRLAPDEYDLYRQLGATLLPFSAMCMPDWRKDFNEGKGKGFNSKNVKLSAAWLKARPSFGCIAVATDPYYENIELNFRYTKDKKQRLWLPKFLYFRKYNLPPPEVQPLSGGDIYVLTVWWDKPQDRGLSRKYGTPDELPVFISKKGEITLLRECKTNMKLIHSRKDGYFHIPERAWRLPDNAVEAAKSWGTTPEIFTANLFQSIVESIEFSGYSMIHVLVHNKEGLTAQFGLNAKRIPYFFQDRDYALTDSGVRKRIFHVVRAHQRLDGSNVRLHFRGDRRFTWAGYDVEIIIPGKHRTDLFQFDVGMDDEYWHKKGKEKTLGTAEIGKWLAQPLKDGQIVPPRPWKH